MNQKTRREFLFHSVKVAAASAIASPFAFGAGFLSESPGARTSRDASHPAIPFPSTIRERIVVASYPFRDFIVGRDDAGKPAAKNKMELKDFAAHVRAKFSVNKIEPWSEHFLSLDAAYLDEIREAVSKAGCAIVDIAADGEEGPYAAGREEREKAIAMRKQWIDAAQKLGSPSVRVNIPPAKDAKPDVARTAESLKFVAEHAAKKNVVVHLENDNPVSEDPFFLVQVIERVNSEWLHALPDFGNSVAALKEEDAYRGIDAMFGHSYGISHVKDSETNSAGKVVHVDMARTFGIAAKHGYKGYFSMEWEGGGDPHDGTAKLIDITLRNAG